MDKTIMNALKQAREAINKVSLMIDTDGEVEKALRMVDAAIAAANAEPEEKTFSFGQTAFERMRMTLERIAVGDIEMTPFSEAAAVLKEIGHWVARANAEEAKPAGHVDMQSPGTGDKIRWTNGALPHGTPLYAALPAPVDAQADIEEYKTTIRQLNGICDAVVAALGDDLDYEVGSAESIRMLRAKLAQPASSDMTESPVMKLVGILTATDEELGLTSDTANPEATLDAIRKLKSQPVAGVVDEREALRQAQARRVMPLIGPLLDAFEGVPNDTCGVLEDECPDLYKHLRAINSAVVRDDDADLSTHQVNAEPTIEELVNRANARLIKFADAVQEEPIGYIDRKDIARLSNYKATIWPGTNEIEAVAVYLNPQSSQEDSKDAERYRIIRAMSIIDDAVMSAHGIEDGKPETLDAFADAAITAKQSDN